MLESWIPRICLYNFYGATMTIGGIYKSQSALLSILLENFRSPDTLRYGTVQSIFIARQHTAVRDTLVLYENSLTYRHSFSTIR